MNQGWIILMLYGAVMISATVLFTRKESNVEKFCVGSRNENLDTLNQFLEELQGDLEIPGFDDEVLRQMVASADEITETLSEYGTLNDEEIQKIQKNSEKRGETAQVEYPIASIIKNTTDATMDTDRPGNVADSETATDIRKYTICPACGTKVWL